jgi:hypothetical protein
MEDSYLDIQRDERVILKWILGKQVLWMWDGFNFHTAVSTGKVYYIAVLNFQVVVPDSWMVG